MTCMGFSRTFFIFSFSLLINHDPVAGSGCGQELAIKEEIEAPATRFVLKKQDNQQVLSLKKAWMDRHEAELKEIDWLRGGFSSGDSCESLINLSGLYRKPGTLVCLEIESVEAGTLDFLRKAFPDLPVTSDIFPTALFMVLQECIKDWVKEVIAGSTDEKTGSGNKWDQATVRAAADLISEKNPDTWDENIEKWIANYLKKGNKKHIKKGETPQSICKTIRQKIQQGMGHLDASKQKELKAVLIGNKGQLKKLYEDRASKRKVYEEAEATDKRKSTKARHQDAESKWKAYQEAEEKYIKLQYELVDKASLLLFLGDSSSLIQSMHTNKFEQISVDTLLNGEAMKLMIRANADKCLLSRIRVYQDHLYPAGKKA